MTWTLIGNLRGPSLPPAIYGDDDEGGEMGPPGPAGPAGAAGPAAITAGLSGSYTSSDSPTSGATWVFNLTATFDQGYLASGTKLVVP
jgi:hypothetical protein